VPMGLTRSQWSEKHFFGAVCMEVIGLLYNLGILISISTISGFIDHRFDKSTPLGLTLQGLLFGMSAAVGMIFPYSVLDGAIFDARSVVISVSALFFGPVAGLISTVIAVTARMYVGGSSTEVGIAVILLSFVIGHIFYWNRSKTGGHHTFVSLYVMGVLVHLAMMLIFYLFLNPDTRDAFMRQFAVTVLIFYPIATVIIGKVINDHLSSKSMIVRLTENEDKLNKNLREKKVLLAEIHHRVKNNLAIISSLLSLQSDSFDDDRTRFLFNETEGRVRSMSLIHELVYQNESFDSVDFGAFLRRFEQVAAGIFSDMSMNVEVKIEANTIRLDLNKSVPCALIVNELITNAYKHAFPGQTEGLMHIQFTETDNEYTLVVSDNGCGMPDGFKPSESTSFGYTIIFGLVDQLQGSITFENVGGTRVTVVFPKELS